MSNKIRRGDTHKIIVTVKNCDGTIKDLTSVTQVHYAIAKNVTGATYLTKDLSSADITIPVPIDGKVYITLTSAETTLFAIGDAYHEVVICEPDDVVSTILEASIRVTEQLIAGCA